MTSYTDRSEWNLQTLFLIIGLIVFSWGFIVLSSFREFIHVVTAPAPPDPNSKVILYWNRYWGNRDFGWGLGYFAKHCPVFNNCYATHDRRLLAVEDFDGLIFHGINGQFDPNDIPQRRRSDQKYVFVSLQSPVMHFAPKQLRLAQFFNTRITYNWDSEVVWTYADIQERRSKKIVVPSENVTWINSTLGGTYGGIDDELERILPGKSKMAIWYVSHCQAHSGRDQYVEELRKYIPVSVFGGCSQVKGCPRSENCFKKEVEPRYLFYLAFENSLCNDYVTEKFFNALKHYVVPVVYGGANYAKFAPSKSYINALDFESPKELAEHLKHLSENITEYKTYFEWKNHYEIISSHKKRVVCELCEILNKDGEDFTEVPAWFNDWENQCPLQIKLDMHRKRGKGETYVTRKMMI